MFRRLRTNRDEIAHQEHKLFDFSSPSWFVCIPDERNSTTDRCFQGSHDGLTERADCFTASQDATTQNLQLLCDQQQFAGSLPVIEGISERRGRTQRRTAGAILTRSVFSRDDNQEGYENKQKTPANREALCL